ncbi:MAG TPA: sigma 54-interacting transcriptional regulator [bacterium]|nr:sigma 54-interacting transcriptional regulator [bacterium]
MDTNDKLERLLDMQERILAKNAEVAYAVALSQLQADLPEIPERGMIRALILFDCFHQFAGAFDELIRAQVTAGDVSVPVPFADDILALLARCGFARDEALRCLALLWQLRRSFYFIRERILGDTPAMRALREQLWNNVFTADRIAYDRHLWTRMEQFSTLIIGETGTGKGTAAAALGGSGFIPFDARRGCFAESFTRCFVSANLSQYPATLIEGELFGYRTGAFTGATADYDGLLARCSAHGAVFLDEIGDLPLPLQVKLLTVVESRSFTPLGCREALRFSGRVIVATNRPLAELRAAGAFRDDFYYRLCSDVIVLPTLRARLAENPTELTLLVTALVARIAGDAGGVLAQRVLDALRRSPGPSYHWPGNVRELEQAVRRVLLSGSYQPDAAAPAPAADDDFLRQAAAGLLDADALLAGYAALLYRRGGTYEEVARKLGIDRRTAKRHIIRHH